MSQSENRTSQAGDDEPCLAALMRASISEIYVIDATTWRFSDVNLAACANLGYDRARLLGLTPFDLAPELSAAHLAALLGSGDPVATLHLPTRHRRCDGSSYPLTLRLQRCSSGGKAQILAIGEDLSAAQAGAAALAHCQARFNAIVSNTPGLVYQFALSGTGQVSFPYLSEGCHSLLGLSAPQLQQAPALFLDLILPYDRVSYRDAMQVSAATLRSWNWEGRIWVEAWKDVKWINLRSTPHARAAPQDGVQWDGIMTNITESKLEQLEVRHSRARLAELTAHMDNVKEQERTRIAREIHDDLGGNLTAIKMALAILSRRLPPESSQLQAKAAYVDALVDRTIEAVHRISLDLRPSVLDFGIVAALEWQIKEFGKHAGIDCVFSSTQSEIDLGQDEATALFRIVQEALTNIAKHAGATRVTVRLVRARHHVSLKITDNGSGMVQSDRAKAQAFGIRGMVERADALGGSVTLSHAPGGGTVVAIKIRRNLQAVCAPAPAHD